jgi:uncharacterized membrane protein YhaH (DUF805 family)
MSLEKRLEQEIGWFKVIFAILVAMDASLLAWITQNHVKMHAVLFWLSFLAIFVMTTAVVLVMKHIFKCLNRLEEV